MAWFKAFPVYVDLENQFQIFIFEKSDFFLSTQVARAEKQTTQDIPRPHLIKNIST